MKGLPVVLCSAPHRTVTRALIALGAFMALSGGAALAGGNAPSATPTGSPPSNAVADPAAGSGTDGSITPGLTCGEFMELLKSDPTLAGAAMLWLDGVYAGRSSAPAFATDWATTLSEGVGGLCAVKFNARRPLIDVVAEVRRQAAGVAAK
jgi:hypothetical protein